MSSIKLVKTHHIRSERDAERELWYFSIVDVIALLTDSADDVLIRDPLNPQQLIDEQVLRQEVIL